MTFVDTPGDDPVSVTGQIAGGAALLAFTIGRGSALCSKPMPTLRLATNDTLFAAMPEDMELNCGDVIINVCPWPRKAKKNREILDALIQTTSGEPAKSEVHDLGDNDFLPWQIGAVM